MKRYTHTDLAKVARGCVYEDEDGYVHSPRVVITFSEMMLNRVREKAIKEHVTFSEEVRRLIHKALEGATK